MAQIKKIGQMWHSDLRINGKRVRRSLSRFKPQAEAMLQDMMELRRSQKHGYIPQEVSLGFFIQRHKQFMIGEDFSSNTMYRYAQAFRMMQNSYPITKLHQITPELLEMLKFRWQQQKKTVVVIAKAIICIKAAMRKAEDWKYISLQNWRTVKIKQPKGRLLYYTVEEYQRLVHLAQGDLLTGVLLMGQAGLRSGEAYWLENTDIDFKRHLIWIHVKEGWHVKGGDDGSKDRYVDMEPDGELERHLKSLARPFKFVISHDNRSLHHFQRQLKRLLVEAVLKGPPHTLRHTFAAHLISSNKVSLEALGKLMGHSSEQTTKIYAHLMPHATQNAIKNLPKVLSTYCPVDNSIQPNTNTYKLQ